MRRGTTEIISEADLAASALAGPGSPSGSPIGTLNQAFRISATNILGMPTGVANNPGTVTLSLSLAASSGAICGGFTLKDADPTRPGFQVSRPVLWYGILVPRLAQGIGQFQLPMLPSLVPLKTTSTTSPTLSGKVVLEVGP